MRQYWKIYLINIQLLHKALTNIGCEKEFFYSMEFFNLLKANYRYDINDHYVIIYLDDRGLEL